VKLRFFVLSILYVTLLLSTENPFDLRENREKIEQETKAYFERLHLKSDINISIKSQNDTLKDINQTPSEKEIIWKKIKEDSDSTQKITIF
jgi:hypothetical protein